MNNNNTKVVEDILLKTNALLEGHFILTSGKHADKYMQCAKITEYPLYTEKLCEILKEQLKDVAADIVIGPAVGGIIVAYELAKQLNTKNMFAERVDGKMVLRRGFNIKPGDKVIVAEDVITTGGSVQEVIDLVKEKQGDVIAVAVFVDRSMGKADFGTKLVKAYTANVQAFDPDDCYLCKEGKIKAEKPGSRNL